MTISEISYLILETLREGQIVDDERLDIRLIHSFIPTKRAEYLQNIIDKGLYSPENAYQSIDLSVTTESSNNINYTVASESIPNILNTKYGYSIHSVSSPDINQYDFTLVNNSHFKMAGNGKFYANAIFCTKIGDKLYFKSKNPVLNTLESCTINAIFEDPLDVSSFDEENDDYPIDIQGIEYIKKSVYNTDVKMFMSGVADEVSDSSGEIKK